MTERTQYLSPVTGMLLAVFCSVPGTSASAVELPVPQDLKQVQPDTAASLLQMSGMTWQLERLPDAILHSFRQSIGAARLNKPFLDVDVSYLQAALVRAFDSERLLAALIEQINHDLSPDDLARLSDFYRSTHGQAISRAEVENSIFQNLATFERWYEAIGLRSFAPVRQRAIEELEIALHATESAVDTLIGMQVALQVSLTAALPADQRQSVADMIRAAQEHRGHLTVEYHRSSLESLAFVFQEQSVDSLRAFTTILESSAGQRYVQAINVGLSRGMLDAVEDLGEAISPLVTRRMNAGL